jgi:hypothetical protein
MASAFTFNKDRRYDGYVSNALYHLIPTLLELPDIKCGEFEQKFKKLIDDLQTDIKNINKPNEKMLYDDDVHLKNAREVIRAIFACIDCILKKIKDENITGDCIENPETYTENPETYTENPETDTENPVVDTNKSLSILQQTFSLTGPYNHE